MIWNLFTAVYVSRVIFEYWYDQGWLKKITMLKLMDKTNIDFIGPRKACMTGSVILIVLGLVAIGVRGVGMYNIDFTGGTLVTIRLNDNDPAGQGPLRVAADRVRPREGRSELPDVTVESLSVGGEKAGERFNIRTTEQKIEKVKKAVLDSFGTALQTRRAQGRPAHPDRRRLDADRRRPRPRPRRRPRTSRRPSTASPAVASTS